MLSGELSPLRSPYPVEPIDPLTVAPNPGEVGGQLYIETRDLHADGMFLACATPRRPYPDIMKDYLQQRHALNFSVADFWEANFETPRPDDGLLVAPKGMSLDDYTQTIRPLFIHPSEENASFDTWLPYDRSVAGAGRFGKHSFLWDGYQMAKGYAADDRWDLVLNIVDNTEYQINQFGYALNGSADFYATRSQPPYFSHEVSMLADQYGPEALVRYLPAIEKEYKGYWMSGEESLSGLPSDGGPHARRTLVRMPDGSLLNRYWDDAEGPRLESYLEDVRLGEEIAYGLEGEERAQRLRKLYKDLRAGAASGWDYSSRWFASGADIATIHTTDILPVDLNSLLARTEQVLEQAHVAAGNTEKAMMYRERHQARVQAINKYLWDPKGAIYRDYDFVEGRQTDVVSAAMSYPLYVGIANQNQTFGVVDNLRKEFLYPGGIITTTTKDSPEQWDGIERVWAPPNWASARGAARMAHILMQKGIDVEPLLEFAEEARASYMSGIQTVFNAHGIVPEKHRGDRPAELTGGGEYELVKALAMPGEAWRAMRAWDPRDPASCHPIGKLIVATSSL